MIPSILLSSLATSSSPWVGRVARSIHRVLIVDPDESARAAIQILFARVVPEVAAVASVAHAAETPGPWQLVVAPADLVAELVGHRVGPVLAVTRGDLSAGLDALDAGAVDCMVSVDEAEVALALLRVGRGPRRPVGVRARGVERLVGVSSAMTELRATIERVAPHRSTVLIQGESGTGKELVARAIHELSGRAGRFVAINCAAIPGPLLESELFGHAKGAFTDAHRDRSGLFEDAHHGTLFLDEVGELPPALQVKLLRAIQESEIRRVGESTTVRVDVRVVAATLRDLDAEVAGGRFREDLYYRLNVLPVVIPPLRDRPDDVPPLIAAFAARHRTDGRDVPEFDDDAVELLRRGSWPGNVRELENTVERAIVLSDGPRIDAAFLAEVLGPGGEPGGRADEDGLSIKKATRALEADLIRRALEATNGNRTTAARLLEISHRALLYKIKEYGLSGRN